MGTCKFCSLLILTSTRPSPEGTQVSGEVTGEGLGAQRCTTDITHVSHHYHHYTPGLKQCCQISTTVGPWLTCFVFTCLSQSAGKSAMWGDQIHLNVSRVWFNSQTTQLCTWAVCVGTMSHVHTWSQVMTKEESFLQL